MPTGAETVEIEVVRLAHGRDLPLPDYATAAAAGADLLAAIDDDIELAPSERRIVPTGISIALPLGFEGQVRPRSGLAAKNGVTVANAPGTIDADYRGGVVLGIATGVAYAVYMLTFRQAQRGRLDLSAAQWLCLNSLLCAAMLGAVGLGEGVSFAVPDVQSWLSLLGLGLVGQVLGWVLIARAMPQLPASLVGLLLLLQPLLSFVFDVLLLARPTVALDWAGLAVSLIGIFVASVRVPAAGKG